MLDRYQGSFVGPIFDHLAGAPPDPIGQVHRIGAQTSEEREVMRPGNNVDRVKLDDTHPIHDAAEVTNVDLPGGTGIGKTLGGQGNPTSLSNCEPAHGFGRVKPTPRNLSLASPSG